jgi:trigger factor
MLGLAISSLAYAPTPLHSVAASRRCFAAAGVRMQEGITCEVEKRPRSSVALKIKIPKGLSSQVHQKVLEDLAKSASVPGFRKGKVPVDAVAATLGVKRVKDGVVEQLVDLGMQQAGQQVQVATAGQARLERDIDDIAAEYTLGGEFDFSVLVDVYPDLSTHLDEAAYSKLSVEVDDVPFNQEAYDAALRKLRDQHVDLIEKGAAAAMGDQLEANMNGYFATADGGKGEPLPQVAGGESLQIEMKEGKFMHGLVEGLVGATDGETRSIAVTFPARSSAPQLAGKQALFEVDVIKVQTRQLPEVNDAFAERVKAGMSWADLDAKLKEGVEQEMADTRQQNTDVALSKALVELLPDDFEVPDTIVQEVTKERFAAMLADLRERGTPDEQLKDLITEERYEQYSTISRPSVEKQVATDFCLKEVASQQSLKVETAQVDDEIMTLQAQAMQRGEKFKESEVRPKVEAQLERKMVYDFLGKDATLTFVEPKELSAEEVLGATPEELAAGVMTRKKEDKSE